MKKIVLLLCLIFFVGTVFAQDAQSYFKQGVACVSAENCPQAISNFKKANELTGGNNPACQFFIGLSYQMSENYTQAVYWYRKAADQGVAEAQHNLGLCYADGKGVTKDNKQAVYWYRKAAEQEVAEAQCDLGLCYASGKGVTKDVTQAVYWYRKAAEQGHGSAQGLLSLCYYKGNGVAMNLEQAKYWARKAIANDDTYTHIKLALQVVLQH